MDKPTIILITMLFLFGVLIGLYFYLRKQKPLKKKKISKYLYWSPRILAITITAFISLFSLDVFSEGYSFWEMIVAFLIHNIPTFILVLAIIIAWKWEHIGGLIFIFIGFAYLVLVSGNFEYELGFFITVLIISGIPILTGILFLLNRYQVR